MQCVSWSKVGGGGNYDDSLWNVYLIKLILYLRRKEKGKRENSKEIIQMEVYNSLENNNSLGFWSTLFSDESVEKLYMYHFDGGFSAEKNAVRKNISELQNTLKEEACIFLSDSKC